MAKKHSDLPVPEIGTLDPHLTYKVGIDPDTSASGIAIWCCEEQKYIAYTRIEFFHLYDLFDEMLTRGICFEVIIEAGWRNPSKMHNINRYATRAKAASIGANVGANHETGRKIVEMCRWLGIEHWELTPTSSKWTPTMIKHLTGIELCSGQQDIIDAMRLVYNLPCETLPLLR